MRRKFKYSGFDPRSRRITWIVASLFLLVLGGTMLFGETNYLTAWLFFIVLALAGFCILSVPRFVRVGAQALEIHCVVEMTTIELIDIKSAREVPREDMRRTIPILGIFGFFGYYGYYYDLLRLDMIKLYATEWNNFVEIEDIYEDKYVISCDNPQEFIEVLMSKSERAKSKLH